MVAIGAIERSVVVLDLFVSGEYELSATDVAKKTGISISTAFRTMSALCSTNMLVNSTSRGKYRLSSKMLDLSRAYMSNVNLVDVALPHMKVMKDKTGESIGLYSIVKNERVCIARVDGSKDIRRVLSPGQGGPIYAGAPSKVLLAYLPDDRIREILRSVKLIKKTDLTKTTIPELMRDLKEVRQNGYAISKGEDIEHAFAVSSPIRDHKGNVIASVAITGMALHLTDQLEKEYTELTKRLSTDISYDMGYLDNGR